MTTASQLTPGQARIVDPVLSQHARGYLQAELVARSLFPFAPVPMYGGKVIQFDKSAFRLVNSARAPGTATKRVQLGYQGEPYAIVPNALEASVPRELMRDATVVPGIDLGTRAINTVLKIMNLGHEVACANIARNTANYDANHQLALSGTNVWSNAASDPSGNIATAREAIRESIGVYPNTCLLSAKAMKSLKFHPQILDRIKYTSRDSVSTQILAGLWEIPNVVVGQAVTADPVTDAFGDVWGPDVVLAYVAPSGGGDASANAEEPSYGYTYLIEGMPLVEQPYWDNNTKSWVYGVSFDQVPVLSGMQGGFLIEGAGS
jgi:hypothetical protein